MLNNKYKGPRKNPVMKTATTIEPPKIGEVLNILSKEGAIAIFNAVRTGMVAKQETAKELGLTKKQYYTRLKELKRLGMVAKDGEVYTHTEFGAVMEKKIEEIGKVLTKEEFARLLMADVLRQSKKFTDDEIGNFVSNKLKG
ncbi:MAG: hypothetical protein KGH71_01895 [Candidatus Micrarchaeota archaeon]|nr:hypothetical protein [Candidatus Micrarchaeota archaeon]